MNGDTVKTALRQCPLFKSFNEDELAILMESGNIRKFSRGKILYRKGEESDDTFCLIISGKVNIVAKDGHIVKENGVGNIIGEIALSDPHHRRTVSVIAKDPTDVLEWNIHHIKEKIPGLWKKLLKLAWEHISDYYEG